MEILRIHKADSECGDLGIRHETLDNSFHTFLALPPVQTRSCRGQKYENLTSSLR